MKHADSWANKNIVLCCANTTQKRPGLRFKPRIFCCEPTFVLKHLLQCPQINVLRYVFNLFLYSTFWSSNKCWEIYISTFLIHIVLKHILISQRCWEEKQNNEQSLTSSASQWCSSPTLQHLQREQKQAEVKNTLPLAEKCKQAASKAVSHLDPCLAPLPLPPSFGISSTTALIFILDQSPVLSYCRPTGILPL